MDLFVLAIDQWRDNETIINFEEEFNTHYPSVSGTQGGGSQVFENYEIPYTPVLILIAPDHTIVEKAIPMPTVAQELIDLLNTYSIGISGVNNGIDATNFDFSFFPNPVSDRIKINAANGNEMTQVKIFQLTGQEILSTSIKSSETSIDISEYQKGIYLLMVSFKNGERVSKTFVKR